MQFFLQLNQREGLNKGTKWSHIWEGIPDNGEMLKEIKKELQNQERLLQGYQQVESFLTL